jgi:tRNA-splicing ligase RtcB
MSRHQAIRKARGRSIQREMEEQGVIVRWTGRGTLAEEMPEAYKDISSVVDVVHNAGLSKKVAKLRPIGVIKG